MEPVREIIVYMKEYGRYESDKAAVCGRMPSAEESGEPVISQTQAVKNQAELQHNIGRKLLEQALYREYGFDISKNPEQWIEKEANGKPFLKGLPIHFNISHCKGMVVCALAPCPVGVDVEGERRVSEGLIKKVCDSWEQEYIEAGERKERFLRLWTLKESYLKMTGEGLLVDLPSVAFRLEDGEENETLWPEHITCSREGAFYQKKINHHYILSICSEKSGFRVREEIINL